MIRKRIRVLEKRLRGSRMRKASMEADHLLEKKLEEKRTEWEDKGKMVYGDAWENATGGSVPMRELFELPENELRELKIEAYNKILQGNQKKEESERIERETERQKTMLDMNTARQIAAGYVTQNPLQSMEDGYHVHPATSMLNVRRKHKPAEGATYHDPRFVSRVKTSRPPAEIDSPHSPHVMSFPQPPPPSHRVIQVERQAPGLHHPKPPSFLPPPLPAADNGIEEVALTLKMKDENQEGSMSLSSIFSAMNKKQQKSAILPTTTAE